MLRFSKICGKGRTLHQLTGLNLEQFTKLADRLEPLWEEAETKRLSTRLRKHGLGQGRRYKLETIHDKLLLVLVFYRFYLVDTLLGWMFGLDASNICRLLKKMEPLFEKAADPGMDMKFKDMMKKRKKISTIEELLEVCPEIAEVITDATEHQCQRPGKKRVRKKYFSGKRRQPTIKTQITVTRKGQIISVSDSYPGSKHDYTVFKKEKTAKEFPRCTKHYLDRGYEGAQKEYPDYNIVNPVKKRTNHRVLTCSEKRFNKKVSKIRVTVEHVFNRMKKYQALKQICRHRADGYNQRIRNIAALINFRFGFVA